MEGTGSIRAEENLSGISIGLIGYPRYDSDNEELRNFGVNAENARYITIHDIFVGIKEELAGLTAGGIRVVAGELRGLAVSGLVTHAHEIHGASASFFNYYDEIQMGLSIGVIKFAETLNGIQIGLLNIANNTRRRSGSCPS